MRYLTLEQRESLKKALESRAAQLRDEVDEDRKTDLNELTEVAALERDVLELRQVEAALERLHEPDFGLCGDCGVEIPFVRLQAAPIVTRCVVCEERHEAASGARHRATL